MSILVLGKIRMLFRELWSRERERERERFCLSPCLAVFQPAFLTVFTVIKIVLENPFLYKNKLKATKTTKAKETRQRQSKLKRQQQYSNHQSRIDERQNSNFVYRLISVQHLHQRWLQLAKTWPLTSRLTPGSWPSSRWTWWSPLWATLSSSSSSSGDGAQQVLPRWVCQRTGSECCIFL